jgi:hypothetical protein
MDNHSSSSFFEYSSRLEFLYKVVEDTQNTIRFLDTKAAFCVTLLTAMMAAAFHLPGQPPIFPRAHIFFLAAFGVLTLLCLSICVRVIFPTVHLQGSFSGAGHAGPTFFLVPKQQRHRLRDTLGNKPPEGLETTHAAYSESVISATDPELVRSMCDEVVTISFLRQVKSDRLHLAIQLLSMTVVAFFIQLAI